MKLALFDLDHTLIPFDSGMAWMGFAASRGLLPPQAEAEYLAWCQRYVAGAVDIQALHRGLVQPLACFTLAELAPWLVQFEAEMAPRLPAHMRALVERHRAAGDLCAIVTATTRLIAEPFARAFGVPHLVATEAQAVAGSLTGEIAGEPCARQHKLARVEQWLAGQGSCLAAFERSWFYSDSASDLPLLSAVSHPVAVRPDDRLRRHAEQAGWPVW
ncbi:HAD family hydrolase [Ideonella sp.]|uniref:HAD family hydrolase n=1 Tax=Ideonella sp. TaxID=1929293 RepID=UPI002B4A5CF3|nr:HAD family hydrolase [Ideonella sp.]HJV72121.1 HAD family hydrolase [Ideonella sp.]